MKILTFLSILFITFILTIGSVLSDCTTTNPCCCQTTSGSGQYRCYTSGVCCLEGEEQYWHEESCWDFRFWVEPTRSMFTTARPTQIILYIHNIGAYTDDYNITSNITSPNPSLIGIDPSGVITVSSVSRGEIRRVFPMITILAASATGNIFFNATSQGDQNITRNATLTILPSDLPASLPEFEFSGMFVLIILAVVVFLLFKKFS